MALLFMDSFDHYVTADLTEKWTAQVVNSGSNTIAAVGRRGSNGYRAIQSVFTGGAAGCWLTKTLGPTGAGFLVGVACKVGTMGVSGAGATILAIQDVATTQLALRVNQDLTLSVLRGATVIATSTNAIAVGAVNYIEWKALIDPTAGTVDVRVNGSATGWISFTGNTRGSSTTAWNVLVMGCNIPAVVGSTNTIDFDDLYVLDLSGAAPWNTFLGDCRVDTRYPTAAGATTGWTPSTGANWSCVDETAPNDDTDYTAAATTGLTDTFVTQDAPVAGAAIYGVQHCLSAKKTDAGAASIAPVIRHSGVDYVGANQNPSTAYAVLLAIAATNPGTAAAWTEAGFNAAEFGYKRTV